MAKQTESTTIREQDQRATSQATSTHHGGGTESESRADREQAIETGREGSSQQSKSVSVRVQRPGWGLTTGAVSGASPFAVVRRVMEDMDRLFADFDFDRDLGFGRGFLSPLFGGIGRDLWTEMADRAPALWSPAIELFEKGDRLVIRADLPGISKDDISVDITDDTLTIEGERRQESEDRGEGYYRSERSYGRFLRTIPLPEGVDADKAEAKFRDGVLEVTLPRPKRERKHGRKLSVH